jgi:hypothetical protein
MSVLKPLVFDQQTSAARILQQGDVIGGAETMGALTTAGAGTLTAALLAGGFIKRTGPAGGFTDTTDSAQNIINQLISGVFIGSGSLIGGQGGNAGVQPGTTWRLRYINTVAFAMTLAAGTGVTIVANGNVNASSVKDYLLTVTNGTPTQVFAATQVTGTAVITGLNQAQTNQLTVGMAVTGTNVAANSVIVSIQPGVGVTLNNNVTASLTLNALTFSPTVTIEGIGQGLL